MRVAWLCIVALAELAVERRHGAVCGAPRRRSSCGTTVTSAMSALGRTAAPTRRRFSGCSVI